MRLRRHRIVSVFLVGVTLQVLALLISSSNAIEIDTGQLERTAVTRYGPRAASVVADWLRLMQQHANAAEGEKLTLVNRFWNQRVREAEDLAVWGQVDYWATPLESLARGAGDCEDFAIGKYFSLVRMGVDSAKLRFIYVRAKLNDGSPNGIAHMVLGYYATPSAVPLVLDSLNKEILPANRRPDLTPVFSFNAEGVYVAGAATAPVDRVSRWQDLLARMQQEGFKP
ncbi:transglutaminase-like cysteine peptidase [Schauerella aestuarii]|uniref:transglutaminase-like cysteine peptidase n=1 Tax=Schauerella aestuarii TaxID=2511204 RepID=UPI00136F6AAF|nr:transglutaminase-like cysteine peptidase [Achromobacter aestuarii]MYZ46107.1 transglutaminase [Achromobacter aestuarii]